MVEWRGGGAGRSGAGRGRALVRLDRVVSGYFSRCICVCARSPRLSARCAHFWGSGACAPRRVEQQKRRGPLRPHNQWKLLPQRTHPSPLGSTSTPTPSSCPAARCAAQLRSTSCLRTSSCFGRIGPAKSMRCARHNPSTISRGTNHGSCRTNRIPTCCTARSPNSR